MIIISKKNFNDLINHIDNLKLKWVSPNFKTIIINVVNKFFPNLNSPKSNIFFIVDKLDKNTWKEAIEHGKTLSIPEEQLDFLTD